MYENIVFYFGHTQHDNHKDVWSGPFRIKRDFVELVE